MSETLTPAELCRLLRVDARTLARWQRQGVLPAVVSVAALVAWMEARCLTVPAELRQRTEAVK